MQRLQSSSSMPRMPSTHYVASRDVGPAPRDLHNAYLEFKTNLSNIDSSQLTSLDEEQASRAIALGQAAYERLRTETGGIELSIAAKTRLARLDLLSAAQLHLEDFTSRVAARNDKTDELLPPSKKSKSALGQAVPAVEAVSRMSNIITCSPFFFGNQPGNEWH